jgi:PAS domain S-box-containing protein
MSVRHRVIHTIIIGILFVLLSLSHYHEYLTDIPVLSNLDISSVLILSRHGIERFLYVLLIFYAGWIIGLRGGIILLVLSAAAMFPRALIISTNPRDALIETIFALVISGMSILLIKTQRKSQKHEEELKEKASALEIARKNYEELFTNASDAIWVHDKDGVILMANKACEKLTGYIPQAMIGKNITLFISPDTPLTEDMMPDKAFESNQPEQPYELHIIRKDKLERIVELTTRRIRIDGEHMAFQNIARDITEERSLKDSLHAQIHKTIKAQEEERKRIARQIHDDITQTVVLMAHRLDSLVSEKTEKLPKAIVDELEQLYSVADSLYKRLQRFALDLRPSILDQMGLLPALNWLIDERGKDLKIKAEIIADPLPQLTDDIELILFRIAQEALMNIRKHSEATEAKLVVRSDEEFITMSISDNGKGIPKEKLSSSLIDKDKMGIVGMRERAHVIGATLTIESEEGKGTTVIVKTPIP